MKNIIQRATVSSLMFLSGMTLSFACTDFRIIAQDETVMITRSMEFAIDMKSHIMTSPRGKEFKTVTADKNPGMKWKAKYGYVFLDGFDLGVPVDGINEEGLAYEALLFPGEAGYQTIPRGQEDHALPYLNMGDWILGNFKTVDEVRIALKDVYVFEQPLAHHDNLVFPVHFSVYDASGKGIVIEYVAGNVKVYDNKIGVMTNSPSYDWHLTNLRNYINLSPTNPKPVMDNEVTFAATGQGAGMIGLPGDISPPSRFVKMAVMTQTVIKPADAAGALNLSQHIINNVDIPLGFVREPQKEGAATNELTQWVVFKDLKNKVLYYRTYDDMTLRAVHLSKLDFSKQAKPLKMPIASKPFVMDVTAELLKKTFL